MNTQNKTVVDPEMLKHLREAGLAGGYEPVPPELESKARELLRHSRGVATMDADMKRKLRNRRKTMRRQGVPGFR